MSIHGYSVAGGLLQSRCWAYGTVEAVASIETCTVIGGASDSGAFAAAAPREHLMAKLRVQLRQLSMKLQGVCCLFNCSDGRNLVACAWLSIPAKRMRTAGIRDNIAGNRTFYNLAIILDVYGT